MLTKISIGSPFFSERGRIYKDYEDLFNYLEGNLGQD